LVDGLGSHGADVFDVDVVGFLAFRFGEHDHRSGLDANFGDELAHKLGEEIVHNNVGGENLADALKEFLGVVAVAEEDFVGDLLKEPAERLEGKGEDEGDDGGGDGLTERGDVFENKVLDGDGERGVDATHSGQEKNISDGSRCN
jgi:hypothetical protein